MEKLLTNIKISVPERIYIKDPESSDLGKRIIQDSITLIHEIGFDAFTFKKLGGRIGSNESSIYRYFENKHKLLVYFSSWYWAWIEYQLVIETHSVNNKEERLKKAIEVATRAVKEDSSYVHINEVELNKIIVHENSKSFLTKEVDQENKEGYFIVYKRVIHRIRDMILDINNKYKYASSLASTILDGALHQHFLKDHFVSITDCNKNVSPTDFFTDLTFKAIYNG
ncbi:MAG: TetR/AcrR family transcriptional regulator [Flavobacteriaceae bacterium]|nr:TetR/AcrR family transcriptional regulator [Flavobacteriaceae bacterium]